MSRFTYFDSLRGIAALIVVIGHFFPEGQIKSLPIINILTDTKLSVCIFFILSGFVLTKNEELNISLTNLIFQCLARFVRLFIPVASISILVYLIYKTGLMYAGEISQMYQPFTVYQDIYKDEVTIDRLFNFIFLESFFFYNNETTLIPPVWTMRPELFGSIFIFIITWFFSLTKIKINPYFLIIISTIIFFTYFISIPFFYYFGFFLMGMSFRKIKNDRSESEIKPIWLIYLLLLKTILEYYKIDSFYLDFIFASLIIYIVMKCTTLHPLMNKKAFLFLGEISFPLYLLHVPIISSLGLYSITYLDKFNMPYIYSLWLTFFAVIILSLILSILFLKIEVFSISFSRIIRGFSKKKPT